MNLPFYKRWWFWLIAVAAAALLFAVIRMNRADPPDPSGSDRSLSQTGEQRDVTAEFIELLIKQTTAGELEWLPLAEDTQIDGAPASDLLGQSEFHQIYYFESYYLPLQSGTVLLVSEFNESGRDSRFNTEGYHLYVKADVNAPVSSVLFDGPSLYRLHGAILGQAGPDAGATAFMERVLQQLQ